MSVCVYEPKELGNSLRLQNSLVTVTSILTMTQEELIRELRGEAPEQEHCCGGWDVAKFTAGLVNC